MIRVLVIVLLVLNLLFFGWTRGWLDAVTGLPAEGGREPQRMTQQQYPERIQPLAASAVAALARRTCLALGPLEGETALIAAQTVLRAMGAGVQVDSPAPPSVWAVVTVRLPDADARARREALYREMRLPVEPLAGLPAEQPAFVVTRHGSQAEAAARLAAFEKRGLKGLRVLALPAPSAQHTLLIQADGLLAERLMASKDPALAAGFKPCVATAPEALPASAAASS